MSEDGPIPSTYPVVELQGAGYRERTLQNVLDSDGTAIIHDGELEGGTRLTWALCKRHGRPSVLIDSSALSHDQAVAVLVDFVKGSDLKVLNVAGPRASKWPGAFQNAQAVVAEMLERLAPRT